MKKRNKKNGISLAVLIITIIVIVILIAGLHLGSGDQGIFGFANRAKLGKLQANETERVELAYITSMISVNGDINEEKLNRELNKIKSLNSQNITKATGADGIEYIVMSTETGLMYTINSITGVTVANIQDYENFKKEQQHLVLLQHFDELETSYRLSTEQKACGNASLILNSTDITNDNTNSFKLTQDFTIDFWVYMDAQNISKEWAPIVVAAQTGGIWIGLHAGKFVVRGYSGQDYISTNVPPTNQWVHIAVTRENNMLSLFYNGVLQKQVSNTTTFSSGILHIGSDGSNNYLDNSYLDEVRISNNTSYWNSNFQPSHKEYKSEDDLIYHFNGNTNNNVIKNSSTINYTNKKIGIASGYFNNTDISFSNSNDYGFTQDFTIDFWLYLDSSNTSLTWAPIAVAAKQGGIWIGLHEGKFVVRGYSEQDYINTKVPTTNQWVHIAITRENNTLYLFYNGKLQEKTKNEIHFTPYTFYIGSDGSGNYVRKSYIDEFRILNGHCVWNKDFNVPTQSYNY